MPAIIIIKVGNRLLMLRRKNNHLWCFPGGKPSQGETSYQTVTRELQEECGITLPTATISFMGMYVGLLDATMIPIAVFSAVLDKEPLVELSSEHTAYIWTTPDAAIEAGALAGPLTTILVNQQREGK
jgi:8-oxo-dGTP diphosphatase